MFSFPYSSLLLEMSTWASIGIYAMIKDFLLENAYITWLNRILKHELRFQDPGLGSHINGCVTLGQPPSLGLNIFIFHLILKSLFFF